MKKSLTESLLWAGASVFFTISAIFGLVHDNLGSVRIQDISRSSALLLSLAFFVTLLLMVIHRPAARVWPVAIFCYFSYFALNQFFSNFAYPDFISYGIIISCILIFYVALRYVDSFRASIYMFVAAAAIAFTSFVLIAPSLFYDRPPPIDAYFERESLAAVVARRGKPSDLPDIFYVIPDRYASRATLVKEFGFDNGSFYAELRKRGFFVSENSWSNYPKTFQSMASTLNSG